MKRVFVSAAAGIIAFLVSSCGEQTHVLDEATVDRLRLLFEQRQCEFRMDDLAFEISMLNPYLLPDSLPPDVIPAEIPDSLGTCPASGLAYQVHFDVEGITITCPSGHGSTLVEY